MAPSSSDPGLREFQALTEAEDLRRALTTAQDQLRRAKARTEDLVAATLAGARDALLTLGPPPTIPKPKLDSRGAAGEVALWHLTDWQGSKITPTYNSAVMRDRVVSFCEKAGKLTAIQRADHPVRECVILFGGDMVEGLFNFPQQPFEVDSSLFGQLTFAARLEAEVVRRALATYEQVTVVQEWGNHGRVGSKRAAVPRADNIDRMVSVLARAIISDVDENLPDRVSSWTLGDEDIQRVEIGKYRALLIHGDEIGRGGQVSINTIINHAKGWRSGAYPWPFRDIYAGHFHSHREIELPWGGMYFQTGSPETDNRYARDSMAASSRPSQRLHFIDPAAGEVTAQYRVWLDG